MKAIFCQPFNNEKKKPSNCFNAIGIIIVHPNRVTTRERGVARIAFAYHEPFFARCISLSCTKKTKIERLVYIYMQSSKLHDDDDARFGRYSHDYMCTCVTSRPHGKSVSNVIGVLLSDFAAVSLQIAIVFVFRVAFCRTRRS